MATLQVLQEVEEFRVVHPLNDVVEEKCSSESLGRIAMTAPVRASLFVLRGYLIAMTLMLVWHVLDMAGVVHRIS